MRRATSSPPSTASDPPGQKSRCTSVTIRAVDLDAASLDMAATSSRPLPGQKHKGRVRSGLAMASIEDIGVDMVAEQDDLDALVSGLESGDWRRPTPAEGWSVGDQIGHLAYFDAAAIRALTAPEQFRAEVDAVVAQGIEFTEHHLDEARDMSSGGLLESWRRGRQDLARAVDAADRDVRVPW